MKKAYIYILKCPEGNIRYVGKTINPKKRLSSHISEAKRNKGRRYVLNWIQSLISKSLLPVIEIIEECDDDNWQEREKYWVEYYRKLIPDLCNNADGGLGGSGCKNYSKEELEKRKSCMSKTMSIFSQEEKIIIWSMIQKGNTVKEIKQIYSNFNYSAYNYVSIGKAWNDITGISKRIPLSSKKDYKPSYEVIEKIKNSLKEVYKDRPLKTCPYCNKEGKGSNMTRYHFDKCINKNN
jgi:hypothetical protein